MRTSTPFLLCSLFSVLIWVSSFSWGYYDYHNTHLYSKIENRENKSTYEYIGNNTKLFYLIFRNNIKCCAVNIAGAGLIGIPTVYNTSFNGRVLGSQISNIILDEENRTKRINRILPHCFEILGFWLSGGVGFFIVFMVYKVLFKNSIALISDLLLILYGIMYSVALIFFAAIIEAYLSFNI